MVDDMMVIDGQWFQSKRGIAVKSLEDRGQSLRWAQGPGGVPSLGIRGLAFFRVLLGGGSWGFQSWAARHWGWPPLMVNGLIVVNNG